MSLLDGISQPKKIIQRAHKVGLTGIACTDHGNISGTLALLEAKKNAIKEMEKRGGDVDKLKSMKVIFGNEFYVNCGEGKKNSHLVVLAKNKDGWKSLIKATSESNKPENFYRKPRLSIEQFSPYANGNLICFSGHAGSDLANVLFEDPNLAYASRTFDQAKGFVRKDWDKYLFELIDRYVQVFGKDNFFIEIQTIDEENFPAATVIAKALRYASKKTGIRRVATADSHYVEKADNKDQWVVLSSYTGKSIPQITKSVIREDDDLMFAGFFRSNNYHIPSPEEMEKFHTEDELACAVEIAESIDEIDPFSSPVIPKFNCPDGLSAGEYMKKIGREGWVNRRISKENRQVYGDRINYELDVLLGENLADYFLILHDIVNFVKSNDKLVGCGRGSVGGSLASYLMGITAVDPIVYGLIFERFFNAGRKNSLPDVDLDIQASFRDKTMEYIKNKYGHERVGQIGTFSRMMGRGCLKEVLRAWEACTPKEMDKITQFIPDESAIADDLQERKEDEGEASIIQWALENNSKELAEWVTWDEKTGQCHGPMARHFEQAKRLEGTHKSRSKHAAGIIIANSDLSEIAPVRYDGDKAVIDFDMHMAEKISLVKFDLLGNSCLDKLRTTEKLIQESWYES